MLIWHLCRDVVRGYIEKMIIGSFGSAIYRSVVDRQLLNGSIVAAPVTVNGFQRICEVQSTSRIVLYEFFRSTTIGYCAQLTPVLQRQTQQLVH
ncbi:unnamed protein product [Gongylonema pulchrum]|uniref:Secreted protein n=1 Tax=Gongylonema pulchrum TaxID=637853 RepID=A0A183E7Q4_9BILA|nr:unnamed protein product [Gongylonema pulchrum]